MIKHIGEKRLHQTNWELNLLILLTLTSSVGAIIYYLYSLNSLGVSLSLILIIAIFSIIIKLTKSKENKSFPKKTKGKIKTPEIVFSLLYLISLIFSVWLLISSGTKTSIVTPWSQVPVTFFLVFLLSLVFLFILVYQESKYSLIFIRLQYFLTFSLIFFIYKIGYGFDPFIHEATSKLIEKKGLVEPKTFYYIGQYSLILILHKITFLPIVFLNKILVPFLAALFLPGAIYSWLKEYFQNKTANLLALMLLLIIPFSWATFTIPQNLAYLFLILTVFWGLKAKSGREIVTTTLLAFSTMLIHPIAGVPALLFLAGLAVTRCGKSNLLGFYGKFLHHKFILRAIYIFLFLAAAISLPLAFSFLNDFRFNFNIPQNLPSLFQIPGKENFYLNFIYLIGFNYKIILSLLALLGIFIYLKNKQKLNKLGINLGLGIAFLMSFIITKLFIPFDFLIQYEKANYTNRILIISLIFLAPFIIIALRELGKRIKAQKISLALPWVVFLLILILSNLYLSYPRKDNYHNSHGLSVSSSDLKAVNWIEQDAREEYLVLANQQVSVAALRELGFDHYLKNDLYFYPIPTGGKLYQFYLDMVYEEPLKENMNKAMDLARVRESYFVLNKYWWAFEKIKNEAKLEADDWEIIDEGKIYIFKYYK